MTGVDVTIPAYNAERFLGDCLESLIGQTLPDWKATVIDDGSTDGTFALAQRYAAQDSRIFAYSYPHGKLPVTRNRGLARLSDAPYVLMLDSDDYLTPDALQTLRHHLEQHSEAVAVYGMPRFVDAKRTLLTSRIEDAYGYERLTVAGGKLASVPKDAPTTFANMVIWPCIATFGQVLIRASALRAAGEFDPVIPVSEDWDMCLRLSVLGDFVRIPQFVLNKRIHDANISAQGKVMAVGEPLLRRKLTDASLYTPEQRRLAHAGHRASCRIKLKWAKDALAQGDLLGAGKGVYRVGRSYLQYRRTWAGRGPSHAKET